MMQERSKFHSTTPWAYVIALSLLFQDSEDVMEFLVMIHF